jgi:PAS domain S-box-containing protein
VKTLPRSGDSKATPRRRPGGLAAALALVFLSAAALFTFWYLPRQRAVEIASWTRDLGVRADLRRDVLDRFFGDAFADSRTVAGYPAILQALDPAASPASLRHVTELLEEFTRAQGAVGAALWTMDGTRVAATGDLVLEDGCARAAREVLASGAAAVGLHLHATAGPMLTFSAPVKARDGVTRGAVTVFADPARWLYPFLARRLSGLDTGEAAIVARDGDDAVVLSPLRERKDAPLRFRRPLGTLGFGARAAFEGSEAVSAQTDYRGVRVLTTGRRLPPSAWALVMKVDEAEALTTFRADARRGAASMAAFILAASALVWGLAQRRERLQEAALASSEARFGALLDEAEDAIFLLDPAGRLLDANRRAERMYGSDRASLLRLSASDLRAPGEGGGAAAAMEKLNREGRNVVTTSHRRADGSTFPAEVRSRRIELGDAAFLIAIVRDVTERRRQEDAIRHSEERYRALFDGMLNGVAYCEMLWEDEAPADFIYLVVNRAFGTLTGLRDVVGRRVSEVIPGIRRENPELLEAYGRVASTGRPETLESFVPALGIWFSISAYSPRKGHFVAVFDNVTEKKKAEEALLETQRQLAQAQKMEAVGRLAGGIAHDFNNLLTVIRGYGELLAAGLEADDARREELAEILKAAERATDLTRQLLAFSRRQTLVMQPLDLGAVADNAEKMLRRLIGEDVRLTFSATPAAGLVCADRGQVEQVLMNLVVNARDAMPGGGPLAIRVFETAVVTALASVDGGIPPGRYVVLSVSDGGCGMTKETLEHAFEPFFTTKETGRGTGLGLSTVFGIVRQSGGHIRVASTPATGSTFELYFPRVDASDAPPGGSAV